MTQHNTYICFYSTSFKPRDILMSIVTVEVSALKDITTELLPAISEELRKQAAIAQKMIFTQRDISLAGLPSLLNIQHIAETSPQP